MMGFFKRKGVQISDTDMIRRMPADGAYFKSLICDDDIPQDLYEVTGVAVTIAGSTVKRKLVRCRDTVKVIISLLKKRQAVIYYVAPRWFALDVVDSNGQRVRCRARFNVTPDTSDGLADWLELNVSTSGATLSVEKVVSLLGGKPRPAWLEVKDVEAITEPSAESAPTESAEVVAASDVPSADAIAEGSVVLGRYRVERELGAGGMGKAFLAFDQKTPNRMREHVVLKIPHIETVHDPHAVKRFVKEAETLSSLRDDRIAACYDCPMLGATPILIMEYVKGESLSDFLKKHGAKIDEKTTKDLLLPIAQALDYAHSKRIFHLDVKPQNIIVRDEAKAGLKTCLLDFGIAKKAHLDGSMTFSQNVFGTSLYMSPDQLSGDTPSAAMDVYSLAVTAYECLTGEMPYPSGWKLSHSIQPIPSETPFAALIMRGLQTRPEERPKDCVSLFCPPSGERVLAAGAGGRRPEKSQAKVATALQKDQVRVAPPEHAEPPPTPAGAESLEVLSRAFVNYRMMLSQSAARVAQTKAEEAAWMRDRQAALRDLTHDLTAADPKALVAFFASVKAKLAERRTRPDEFFVAADRLMELRCGLPAQRGPVGQAIFESVN